MRGTVIASLALSALLAMPLYAQDSTTAQQSTGVDQGPITLTADRVQSIPAINYNTRSGSTMIDFRGTNFQPLARGDAKIEAHTGRMTIKPKFVNLKPANTLGPEYLTYVLWAITPEGRPQNLGEVIPNDDGKVEMTATTNLQTFGLMVTAEPYFAVTRPSSRIVLENAARSNTKGVTQPIFAKFETLEGGDYVANLDPSRLPATGQDPKKVPLAYLQAQNAVAIARQAGADHYAPDAFRHASDLLTNSEAALRSKGNKSSEVITASRSAVQAAEDALVLTVRRKADERAANERQAVQQQADLARQQAQQESTRADQARVEAEAQRLIAERDRLQAQQQQQQLQQQAAQAQEQAMTAQQQAEQARQERAIAEAARQQAEQEHQQALAQAQQAQAQALSAQQKIQQAEQEREQMRSRLQQELNQVLQTRDTARGLIVNMSDVLFDTGQATLRPGARLRLAKIAGIMAAHPDLHLAIEGHTDNVGGDSYNQQLSERRAEAVRTFLTSQGVSPQNVDAHGFGKTQPIASNDTPTGRQLNRRVDIVVSGESIQTARAGQAPAAGASAGVGANAGGVSGSAGATTGVGTTTPSSTGTVAQPTTQTPPPTTNPPQQ